MIMIKKNLKRAAILTMLALGLLLSVSPCAMAEKGGSSIALINKAYHAGEIDRDTYMLLKAQAIFKPEKLPAQYKGAREPIRSLTLFIIEIQENWEDLSKKTKDKLLPFLLRPTDPSYPIDINGDGMPDFDAAYAVPEATPYDTTNFRIHYVTSTDDAPDPVDNNSNGIPDYVETVKFVFEEVYSKEITNMNYSSPPDDGTRGGDSKYDVYLKEIGKYDLYGWASREGLVSGSRREYYSFIVVDDDYSGFPGLQDSNLKVTAAHEFFHAVQFGYDGKEDASWMEATAVWMEDEVYDNINDYLQYLPSWFASPQTSLDEPTGTHMYGSCIYAKYLSEKEEGGVDKIRTIWERCRGRTQSLDAITEDLDGIGNFRKVFKNFTTANFINRPTRFIDPQYNYEDDAAPIYPDMNIEASYPTGTEPNQHFVGKDPQPTEYGDRLYMLDDKKLPHLASHYLKFTPPEQLDKPTKLYINFKKGPGSPNTWGTKFVLVQNNNQKIVRETTKEDKAKGTRIFSCAFGLTRDNPRDTEIKEVLLTPSNLDQRSGDRKYQYSAVVIPQFEDVYTPNPNSGTSKTVYNFDPDNVYKNGDTIHLEVNLSYKARVTADFSEVDVNFNPNNVVVTESDPIQHKYEIIYTIDTAAGENGLPVKIKAEDLTGTGFNIDETFLVNQASLVITIIYPQDGETIFERRPTIVAEITSLIGVEIDLSSIMMTLDTSVVEHNWRALSPDRSSVEIYYTPTEDLSYDQHTVTVDAKDINGLAAEQKVWTFIIEEMPWRFKVTPAYMLSGESAIVSLRSLENTPTKTVRYTPGKMTNIFSTWWGPERYITLTNQGKDGNFFLYTGTITPSDYLDGHGNDGSGSGELYCNDGGTIRKCSLGISDVLTTADIVIEEVSPIFEKPDGPYVTVTGYFRQFAWAGGSMCGMILNIDFINYDEYLQFAERGGYTSSGGGYGTVWEDAQHIKYMWLRATKDVKLHEGENLIQIYHLDASSEYYLSEDIRYVGASTIVNVPSGVCTSQVAARNISQVAADVSGPDPTFKLGEVYSFPNPAKRGKCPTIHFESGIADRVEINIYDIAGDLVHSSEITDKPEIINGKYAYEYRWNVSNVPSGVYIYLIRAKKSGEKEIKVVKKLAVVK